MTAQRPTVLHVISSLHVGGAERMLVKLCQATQAEFAHEIVALIPGGALAEPARAAGAMVEELAMGRSWRALGAVPWLRRRMRQSRPAAVMGWMYHAAALATLAAAGLTARPPLIWTIRHTPGRLAEETRLTRAALVGGIALSRMAQAVVYNARRSAERHRALGYGGSASIVIPNGFDVSRFQPDAAAGARLRAELGLAARAPLLGRVARWHPMKDDRTLLAAFARIRATMPEARLVLVGQGMEAGNATLATLAREMGVGDALVLLGPRTDIEAITPAFDVALSSSARGEAFPNVIGEAMACAVPAVATDVGDSAAIIDDPARIAPPGAPDALAQCVLRLLAAAPEARARIGARDRARVMTHYSLDAVAERYRQVWRGTY